MNIQACLSHKTDDWKTPTDLYNNLMEKYTYGTIEKLKEFIK